MATGETFPGYQKYTSDAAGVYSIRASTDVIALAANTTQAASFTDARVKVSVGNHGQKRKSGIKARGFILGLPVATGSTVDLSKTFTPIFTKAGFDAVNIGATVTYQSGSWIVRDKINEA